MRVLTIILFLIISSGVFGQDVTYWELLNSPVDVEQPYKFTQDPVFKPALVLTGTFVTNYIITQSMLRNGKRDMITRPTTIVFITGGLISVGVYLIGKRK